MLLYIHGFRTTPNSEKSRLFKEYFKDNVIIPDFSPKPLKAVDKLQQIIKQKEIKGLIASSLGGYYATYLSERYNLKAVLINPSTRPFETLEKHLGVITRQDGTTFEWKGEYLKELKSLYIQTLNPKNYLVFLQKGDKVLDYRVALKRFDGAKIVMEEGGSHSFDNLERYLNLIENFLNS